MSTIALIVAAGRGHRLMGTCPKQYRTVGGRSVLRHALMRFLSHPAVDGVRVVIHPDDRPLYDAAAEALHPLPPVAGGARRQDSVRCGLESLKGSLDGRDPDRVLIHDAARPFPSPGMIERVITGLADAPATVPVIALADTLKRGSNGQVVETVPRDGLFRAQTPQGFHFATLLAAHQALGDGEVTDDAAVMEAAGRKVAMVPGSEDAFKVTTPEDLMRAEAWLDARMESRIGFGTDVHGFGPGDGVRLCGVDIPHSHGLKGHSDADAGLHAITDAILGALADGDIGQYFPSDDDAWKGQPSRVFLELARDRLAARGGRLVHLDLTIICERPKIGPQRQAMAQAVAAILGVPAGRISIKATTTDGLGFTGRREGIAAQAVATVRVPGETL